MKKLFAVTLTLLMLLGSMSLTAFAETETLSANVYVTIADREGKPVLTQQKITVTDIDGDKSLTINDALYAAHEAKYEGGAAAGYNSYHGDYGLSLGKLWGAENGSGYGYYVNNASAWSLADPVKEGDYINAFVYTQSDCSDKYCWFDVNTVATDVGKDITLALSAIVGYDAENNYAPIEGPIVNAAITVNGEKTAVKTDAEGKATIQIAEDGKYVISAVSDTQTLVAPICIADISAVEQNPSTPDTPDNDTNKPTDSNTTSPDTGDYSNLYLYLVLAVVSLGGIVFLTLTKKRIYEN